MSYFVGAYAASPNTATWNPELEAQYYAKLSALPNVKGLEHPFLGSLHPHDDAWFISHIDPKWRFVFTCIPGVMAAMARNPHIGLASDDASGRQEALAFVRQARDAIATLNAACGSHVVDAIEIHSAPDKTRAASSVASLTASLAELVQWDWQGARLVIEHCDAHVPGQVASKGFLTLADEIAAIEAYLTDPTSAFGGIIAFNCPVDIATAQALGQQFVEVLMAPSFTGEALQLLQTKANVRVLQIALPPGGDDAWSQGLNAIDVKRIGSGLLMQTADNHLLRLEDMQVVTKLQPSPAQMQDLLFAWKVAKFVKSNAIVFAGNGMTLGVGAGQMSRLDSARMAGIKAGHANLSLKDSVVASDAFFPFRDGLDVVVDEGASCVIQPGGSMRDAEVIAAADERGVSMVFTGVRHFRH